MPDTSRRDFIRGTATAALLAATAATPTVRAAENPKARLAYEYQHTPVALPFDAKSLKGLSETLIQSHWENNYSGAVKALNVLRGRLAQAAGDANKPP